MFSRIQQLQVQLETIITIGRYPKDLRPFTESSVSGGVIARWAKTGAGMLAKNQESENYKR